ncbi:MAG: endonuclease/exonuclease/phosphatase family protein [Bacteroidota bacterium]
MNIAKLWSCIILLLLLQRAEAQTEMTLRMMTYNLKFDDTRDSINNWTRRKDQVIGLLSYHAPDIFGTQEGLHHQLEDIKLGLAGFEYIGVARDDGKRKGEYSALFYDAKKFEIVRSGTFWLSESSEIPSKSWDAALPRICTWAELRPINSMKTFFVFNTHFDHVGRVAREESIKLIINHIKSLSNDRPVIFMGDLNFTPDAVPYQLIKAFMQDTRKVSHSPPYGPEATFNAFQFQRKPERRIDYIFISSDIKAKGYATLSDSKNMAYPSDHFPVLVDLEINEWVE